ncbi:MAG: hypothetical protein A4E63_02814 [Syntrophorhabdus sp. PtaU1.Bin050]|nr:MAG: hypothetical protein A4E63_02814 [Syntrophorhabdus sp. PtaU1.Bin050]
MAPKYKLFVSEDQLDIFKGKDDVVFTEELMDEETHEAFRAQVMIRDSAKEGYEELIIQVRGGFLAGTWYVKVIEKEEEEPEETTVFQAAKLGERRGYMLRSMMAEQKGLLKKETMTDELEKRMKKKQELVQKVLDKKTE